MKSDHTNVNPDHISVIPDHMNVKPDHMKVIPDHMNGKSEPVDSKRERVHAEPRRPRGFFLRPSAPPRDHRFWAPAPRLRYVRLKRVHRMATAITIASHSSG